MLTPADPAHNPAPAAATENRLPVPPLALFAVIFTAIWLLHAPLLRLPYFWDETGYFIPAARDLLITGNPIPTSTLSNAHPPLVPAWLAFWWWTSGYTPAITRTAMLLVAAFTLLGVFRLARQVANLQVAVAATLLTAVFPVSFAQSSLAQLDMAAAAFTLWGLSFYLRDRRILAIVLFALAGLAKETAIVAPLALLVWERIAPRLQARRSEKSGPDVAADKLNRMLPFAEPGWGKSLSLLLAAVPLVAWLAFHYARTGHVFGNPEFFRYNVQATANPVRMLLAALQRLWQLFLYLNMFVLTGAAALAMLYSPVRGEQQQRPRIAISVQLIFAVLLLAYVAMLAVLGGAVLARYLLPVYPLVIIVCVSTLWRRVPWWTAAIAVTALAFAAGLFVSPPYRIAPEDNLSYADYVRLHQAADGILAKHAHKRVLTAWPASDELTKPYLGYVPRPVSVVRIENFSAPEIELAARQRDQYDFALLFSTKYEPPQRSFASQWWQHIQERFFDYHRDLPPDTAAQLLGGRLIYRQHRGSQWIAIIAIEHDTLAKR
ncbi:MAG: ArnT family glycosyltransferase [Terriglobales bacterium]